MRFLCFLLCVHLANCLYYTDGSEKLYKDKIVGGRYVDIKLSPYLAQVIVDGIQICGGSILTKEWILSAAHCFEDIRGKRIHVTTGSSYQGDGRKHALAAVHVHRSYDKDTLDNDIALIKLRRPMTFDESRKPIAVSTTLPKVNEKMKISGFGRIGEDLDYSDDLKAAVVRVIDWHECQRKYKNVYEITTNMFCASRKGTDSCQGDSGGPGVINGTLSGIISFGRGCASTKYPGIYTQIYSYREWIANKTGLELF